MKTQTTTQGRKKSWDAAADPKGAPTTKRRSEGPAPDSAGRGNRTVETEIAPGYDVPPHGAYANNFGGQGADNHYGRAGVYTASIPIYHPGIIPLNQI